MIEGFNSAHDWHVAEKPVPDYFEKVYQAAWVHFGKGKCLSYQEILDWVEDGALGPDGKQTIDKASRNTREMASRAAQALTGFVFDRGQIQSH